jgi:hypothetical protein
VRAVHSRGAGRPARRLPLLAPEATTSAQPLVLTPAATLGLDVGDRYCHFCLVDAAGTVLERGRFLTTPAAARAWLGARPAARVVLETGTHSPWLSRAAAKCGHEVLVANTRRVGLIAVPVGRRALAAVQSVRLVTCDKELGTARATRRLT